MWLFRAIFCCFSLIYCVRTCLDLTVFLSTQNSDTLLTTKLAKDGTPGPLDKPARQDADRSHYLDVALAVSWDVLLALVFIMQHRFMASDWWKKLLEDFGITTTQRSIYVLATSFTLQYVMSQQEPVVADSALWYWEWEARGSVFWVIVFYVIHGVAWFLLYGTCLVMDLPELLGVRQVYYEYLGLPPPMSHKSMPTRRLYDHMRHGGATCLLVVLWLHPLMTWTRFILALSWTLFMFCGFAVHEADYIYLREQIIRKRITLRLHQTKRVEILQ